MDDLADSWLLPLLRSLHIDGDGVRGLGGQGGNHGGDEVLTQQNFVSPRLRLWRLSVSPWLSRCLQSLGDQTDLVHLPIGDKDVSECEAEEDESCYDSAPHQDLVKSQLNVVCGRPVSPTRNIRKFLWYRSSCCLWVSWWSSVRVTLTMLSAGPPSVLLTGSVSAWRWLRCIISQHLNTTIRYLRDTTDRVICPYLTSPYLPHNKAANTMNVDQSNSLQTFCRNRRDIFPVHRSRLPCAEAPPEMRGRTRTQSTDHGSPRCPWCSRSWCCRPSGTATPTHRRCWGEPIWMRSVWGEERSVSWPAPLPVVVSPAEQRGPVPHHQAAQARVDVRQGEVGGGEILESIGENYVQGKDWNIFSV